MFGHFSYLVSILIFAGAAVLIELIFGYHIIKRYRKLILLVTVVCLIFTPIDESVALAVHNWVYSAKTTWHVEILGTAAETYIFTAFVAVAVSVAAIAWTNHEDAERPIIKQTIKDFREGTFAIWRKQPNDNH